MSAEDVYVKGVKRNLGYHATWIPTTQVQVGDLGRMEGPTFVPTSSMSARGVRPKVVRDTDIGDMHMSVGRGLKLTVKAEGSALDIAPSIPNAKAGIVLECGKQSTAVLAASGCVQERFADVEAVAKQLRTWWNHWDWDRDLVLVTHVVKAKKATILVAEDGGAKFELTADGSGNIGSAQIADLSAGFKLTGSYNSAYSMVGRSNLTPLFRTIRVTFWGGTREAMALPEFDEQRRAAVADQDESPFGANFLRIRE